MIKSILIIDDNSMMREFLKNLLSKIYDIHICANINEAYNLLSKTVSIDLILLDYLLGEDNCLPFLKLIRVSEFYKSTPVFILSGKQSSEIRIECLRLGAKDFLTKPFNPNELKLRIQNLINE